MHTSRDARFASGQSGKRCVSTSVRTPWTRTGPRIDLPGDDARPWTEPAHGVSRPFDAGTGDIAL